MKWIDERCSRWDETKAAVVGAEAGVFALELTDRPKHSLLPGEWWRVEMDGEVVGYGWLDVVWGDAEILLAVRREARGRGVGTFILERLEEEARARGLNYLTNVVRSTHPRADEVAAWLRSRGFTSGEDGRLLRSVVRRTSPPPAA